MIHDVSIPAALIAGLVSFLSPCVLPLVPPYLIYLTGATIEHVANDETDAASRRAVMISALMFVLGFSTVFVALGASAAYRKPDPRLVGAAFDRRRHRHHLDGSAFPRADPDRLADAGGQADGAEAGRAVGRLCDGAGLRVRLDALHRADPGRDPVGRRRRGDGGQGRGAARGLFRRARDPVSARGLHDRAVLVAVCADEAASRQRRAGDGRADGHHRHRLSHRPVSAISIWLFETFPALQNFG